MKIKKYREFRKDYLVERKINEELNIKDFFSNLFKSKETKQLEKSIGEWEAINNKFIEIFSKNKNWKEYLSWYSHLDGVTSNLANYWDKFINSDTTYYPFKVAGKSFVELNKEETDLLRKMIEQSINMRNQLQTLTDRVGESSTQLELNFNKLNEEFEKDLAKIESVTDRGGIKDKIDARIDLIKTILKDLNKGQISLPSKVNGDQFDKLINDIFLSGESIESYMMSENSKINYLGVFLDILENFDAGKIKDKIDRKIGLIKTYQKIKKRLEELQIEKLIGNCQLSSYVDVAGKKVTSSSMCQKLGISPGKYSDKSEEFKRIKNISSSLMNIDLDYAESIESLMKLCDSVLSRDSFLSKLQITTAEIIKENKLSSDDIYFTHSSKSQEELNIDNIKFQYDESTRGERDESTPKHAWGFYMTVWQKNVSKDYDAANYLQRSKDSAGFFGYDKISLYVIKVKNDSKFLRSPESAFGQTNQSTGEFADYCKSIGLSGYYHPNPYGKESALEVVIIDKDCVESFRKDDESKKRILESIKK